MRIANHSIHPSLLLQGQHEKINTNTTNETKVAQSFWLLITLRVLCNPTSDNRPMQFHQAASPEIKCMANWEENHLGKTEIQKNCSGFLIIKLCSVTLINRRLKSMTFYTSIHIRVTHWPDLTLTNPSFKPCEKQTKQTNKTKLDILKPAEQPREVTQRQATRKDNKNNRANNSPALSE